MRFASVHDRRRMPDRHGIDFGRGLLCREELDHRRRLAGAGWHARRGRPPVYGPTGEEDSSAHRRRNRQSRKELVKCEFFLFFFFFFLFVYLICISLLRYEYIVVREF
jgi:hypothetical protein